jgi:hypothetical protein
VFLADFDVVEIAEGTEAAVLGLVGAVGQRCGVDAGNDDGAVECIRSGSVAYRRDFFPSAAFAGVASVATVSATIIDFIITVAIALVEASSASRRFLACRAMQLTI